MSERTGGVDDGRLLRLHVLRYNPQDESSTPHVDTFEVREAAGMTLFVALTEIRETQDASLNFDFVCRAGICGSCGMMINGRPGLACRTLTKDLEPDISLAPLPVFELISDLSVNTGNWMRDMAERLETWVHDSGAEVDVGALEERMEPELARDIYELERCIECGCCVAACGTAHSGSTRSRASGWIRATTAATPTSTSSSATSRASSAA